MAKNFADLSNWDGLPPIYAQCLSPTSPNQAATRTFMSGRIGNGIAQYRKQHQLTQAQLAQRLGTTQQAVSRWEHDNLSLPDISIIYTLGQVLGDEFLADIGLSPATMPPIIIDITSLWEEQLRAETQTALGLSDEQIAIMELFLRNRSCAKGRILGTVRLTSVQYELLECLRATLNPWLSMADTVVLLIAASSIIDDAQVAAQKAGWVEENKFTYEPPRQVIDDMLRLTQLICSICPLRAHGCEPIDWTGRTDRKPERLCGMEAIQKLDKIIDLICDTRAGVSPNLVQALWGTLSITNIREAMLACHTVDLEAAVSLSQTCIQASNLDALAPMTSLSR